MGILDRIGGGDDVSLTVSVDPSEVAPGGEVTVRYDVAGELDEKCRAVVVSLKSYGSFMDTEEQFINGQMETKRVERAVEVHSEEREFPAAVGSGEAVFTVPDSAPPSSLEVVSWRAVLKVDRASAGDPTQSAPFSVRLPADRISTERVSQQSEEGLKLDVPGAVRAGDELSGTLEVALHDDLKVSSVSIRLYCDSSLEKESTEVEVELSGKREFAAGSAEQIPFTIAVPAGAGPTTQHDRAHVSWRLEGVLDRRLRGDITVDVPVTIC